MNKIASKITGIEEHEYFSFHQDKREINTSKVEALIKDALENECDNGEDMVYVVNCARKYSKHGPEDKFDDDFCSFSSTSKIWIRNSLNRKLRAKIPFGKIAIKKATFKNRRSSVGDAGFKALTLDPIPKVAKFDFSPEPPKVEKEEASEIWNLTKPKTETLEIVLNECDLTEVSEKPI